VQKETVVRIILLIVEWIVTSAGWATWRFVGARKLDPVRPPLWRITDGVVGRITDP